MKKLFNTKKKNVNNIPILVAGIEHAEIMEVVHTAIALGLTGIADKFQFIN